MILDIAKTSGLNFIITTICPVFFPQENDSRIAPVQFLMNSLLVLLRFLKFCVKRFAHLTTLEGAVSW